MKGLASVTKRFPMHELAIRRLYAADSDFRETCEGHATASRALERWRAHLERADEYRALITEIEEEIAEYLEGRRGATNDSGPALAPKSRDQEKGERR